MPSRALAARGAHAATRLPDRRAAIARAAGTSVDATPPPGPRTTTRRTRHPGLAATAAATFVVALAALLTNIQPAAAHARVESTAPTSGAVVERAPQSVSFTFDETVESSFGAVRVFDRDAERVDTGKTFHPGQAGPTVAVRLRPGLPQGTYTATYRVISADGHPVSGGFVFSIGKASAASAETVTELAGKAGGGPVTSTAFAITRALQYGAIATAIGLLAFLLLVLPRGPAREAPEVDRRARRILFTAGAVGAVSGVLAVLLEGAIGGGTSLWTALSWTVIRETLNTRFGIVWWAGAVGWVLVAMVGSRIRALRLEVIAAPTLLLALLPAFGGHAATQHPEAVYVLANVVHVAAISVWFGGLVALLVLIPAGARAVPGLQARAIPRFSRAALIAVVLILASGTLQAVLELTAVDDLVDTAFGRAVLIKILLLGAAGVLAARNHRATGRRQFGGLVVAVRGEVALVVAIFAASGALGGYPPPTQIPPGPFEVTAPIGPYRFMLTVDPATVGPNQLQLMLMQAGNDDPVESTKQLTVTAVEADRGIGPLEVPLQSTGHGTFSAPAALFPAAGTWKLTIVDRVSDFDEYTAFATVPIP